MLKIEYRRANIKLLKYPKSYFECRILKIEFQITNFEYQNRKSNIKN